MDNYNGFVYPSYQPQQNYYQQTGLPVYQSRNWNQPYQQPQQTTAMPQYQQVSQPINNTNINWVQGLEGAKAAQVQNGCNMAFFDSENPCIYIKSVDASGKPSLTILDYVDRNAEDNKDQTQQIEYATKEQMDELSKQFSSITDKLGKSNKFVTKDQFDDLSSHINELSGQIEEIENRITSFGKPQSSTNSNNRRGNK